VKINLMSDTVSKVEDFIYKLKISREIAISPNAIDYTVSRKNVSPEMAKFLGVTLPNLSGILAGSITDFESAEPDEKEERAKEMLEFINLAYSSGLVMDGVGLGKQLADSKATIALLEIKVENLTKISEEDKSKRIEAESKYSELESRLRQFYPNLFEDTFQSDVQLGEGK